MRAWPGRGDIAHLILTDHTIGPSASGLADWIRRIVTSGYDIIRTGAIAAELAPVFRDTGFREIQRLALLELDDDSMFARFRKMRSPLYELRPLRSLRSMQLAADIDALAFEEGWNMDAPSIREACSATPQHRLRMAVTADDHPVGYMVTGRSDTTGFVQRLAVDPAHRGLGVGSALLQDGLSWLARHRVTSVLVNTHLDNQRALDLYRRWGFHRLEHHLEVLEWSRHGSADSSVVEGTRDQ